MKKAALIFIFAMYGIAAFSQNWLERTFPKSAVNLQYAGSTGFATAGFFKVSRRDKIELGILYGYLPASLGGENHSLSLKLLYNPFQLQVSKHIQLEPLQIGTFMCQNFNKNLGLSWGPEYEKGYYWWTRSLRFHIFASGQVSYKLNTKHIDRLAAYFEANTNDLYLYSYLPNRRTMYLSDIFFFGTGIKMYLQ